MTDSAKPMTGLADWLRSVASSAATSEPHAKTLRTWAAEVEAAQQGKCLPPEPDDAMQLAGATAIRFDTTVINKMWTANAVYRAMYAAHNPSEPT